jgi:protein tyrosine phosphatase
MPEGLAPLDPASLDDVLLTVINNYTLHGTPVLVHCRGGVGRAGVVACCWLIRLGLCGWIQEMDQTLCDDCHVPDMISSATESIGHTHQVLQYLRRVIGIVRSRRSAKAVETYEQVKFLVEYVEYLRQRYCVFDTDSIVYQ